MRKTFLQVGKKRDDHWSGLRLQDLSRGKLAQVCRYATPGHGEAFGAAAMTQEPLSILQGCSAAGML